MPSRSAKVMIGAVAGMVVVAAGAGVFVNQQQARTEQRRIAFALTGGDPVRGRTGFEQLGCGGCHELRGNRRAIGRVGPDLSNLAERAYIAGRLRNRPENLIRWIENPQAVDPGTAMPNLNISPKDARDLAAYLYALS